MEKQFWIDKWDVDSIGFHKSETHPELLNFFNKFDSEEKNVLVPLCGKTLDMIHFQKNGFKVTGIEFSPKACEDFFKENNIEYNIKDEDGFKIYNSESITLYCGDFYKYHTYFKFAHAYDRAAIVAIDPEKRKEYADKYSELMATGGKLLLMTFEYDQSKCQGPPWSTEEYFIYEFFEKSFDIELIKQQDIEIGNPRMKEAGVGTAAQKVFLLTKK